MDRSDESLMEALRESDDQQALAELVRRYLTPLYNYCYRLVRTGEDAEDITQETFVKVWQKARTFKKGMPFKPWLYRIARNTVIDHSRKKKHLTFSDIGEDEDYAVNGSQSHDMRNEIIAKEDHEHVERVIGSLPASHQELIMLHLHEGMTFEEIASVTGRPLNTVKSQYRRILVQLQNKLKEK